MSTPNKLPNTLVEVVRHFADLDVANQLMASVRWPEGVTCPYCEGTEHSFISTRRTWACKGCKKRFTVKVGTVMEDSPIGLDKWIVAMWLLADCKNGISSHEVARHLGISQKSAWFLMHRIRLAMQRGTWEQFEGHVEADETYIGGKAKNMHSKQRKLKIKGTGAIGKAVVMGMLRRTQGKVKSEVQVKVIKNNRKGTVQGELRAHVAPGSQIYTDALASYNGLNADYVHQTIDHAVCYAIGKVHTNGIENFWCLLDRSIDGTYVSVDPDHLPKYVDEQAFRFNEREFSPRERFLKAAQGVTGKRLTWEELVYRAESNKPRRGGGKRKPS